MAPLTNAERQKRYRLRIKQQVRGIDLADRARQTIADGLRAVWAIVQRDDQADLDGFSTFEDYLASHSTSKNSSCATLREDLVAFADDRDDDLRLAIQRAVELIDAVHLRAGAKVEA